jgi:hypothetical protein
MQYSIEFLVRAGPPLVAVGRDHLPPDRENPHRAERAVLHLDRRRRALQQ